MSIYELRTARLLLRSWQESDNKPFIAMGLDERVMEYFATLNTAEQSRDFITRMQDIINEQGWGMWAAQELASEEFIGIIGIKPLPQDFPVVSLESPPIEIGWRLRPEFWNKGYATEGALASLELGFNTLNLKEIVSITSFLNAPSIRVMEKIGMKRDMSGDFDHPRIEEGSNVRKHLLYRITNQDWKQQQ